MLSIVKTSEVILVKEEDKSILDVLKAIFVFEFLGFAITRFLIFKFLVVKLISSMLTGTPNMSLSFLAAILGILNHSIVPKITSKATKDKIGIKIFFMLFPLSNYFYTIII